MNIKVKVLDNILYLAQRSPKLYKKGDNPYDVIWLEFVDKSDLENGNYSLISFIDKDEVDKFTKLLNHESELIKLKVMKGQPSVFEFKTGHRFSNFLEYDELII